MEVDAASEMSPVSEETGASTEPPSPIEVSHEEACDDGPVCIRMSHFPTFWVAPGALAKLPLRITSLLSRFGQLSSQPEIIAGTESKGSGLAALATFEETAAARQAVKELHGFDWRTPAEVQRSDGQQPEAWQRFRAEFAKDASSLDDEFMFASEVTEAHVKSASQAPSAVAEGAAAALAVLGSLSERLVEDDHTRSSETYHQNVADSREEVSNSACGATHAARSLPVNTHSCTDVTANDGAVASSLGACTSGGSAASSPVVRMKHFPATWQAPEALSRLPARIAGLLSRFGSLARSPEITTGAILEATAAFCSAEAARAAVAALHGMDLRSEAEVSAAGGAPAGPLDCFWLQQELECSHARASDSPAPKVATVDKMKRPSNRNATLRDNTESMEEPSYLLIKSFPPSWGELQVQLLFNQYCGVDSMSFAHDAHSGRQARVVLVDWRECARAARAVNHTRVQDSDTGAEFLVLCEHEAGQTELRLRAEAEEAERVRREVEEQERRQQAEIAEARHLACMAEPEQRKRLEAAAAALAGNTGSKQRRRMFAALLEAERKRQAPIILKREVNAMSQADAEAESWRWKLAEAERLRQIQELQAEAAERRLLAEADVESRLAEEVRVRAEEQRKRLQILAEAREVRAMARSDYESQQAEVAALAELERRREEAEKHYMQQAETEQRERYKEQLRREEFERKKMSLEERWQREAAEEEIRRKAKEEQRRRQLQEWQQKRQLLHRKRKKEEDDLLSDDEEEAEEEVVVVTERKGSKKEESKVQASSTPRPRNCLQQSAQRSGDELQREAEERQRLKQETEKRKKEEAEEELQRFELEQQRRRNFLARRRQQEEDEKERERLEEQRRKDEAEQRRREQQERHQMDEEDRRRQLMEQEERKEEAEKREKEALERRMREKAEQKRRELEEEAKRRRAENERMLKEQAERAEREKQAQALAEMQMCQREAEQLQREKELQQQAQERSRTATLGFDKEDGRKQKRLRGFSDSESPCRNGGTRGRSCDRSRRRGQNPGGWDVITRQGRSPSRGQERRYDRLRSRSRGRRRGHTRSRTRSRARGRSRDSPNAGRYRRRRSIFTNGVS